MLVYSLYAWLVLVSLLLNAKEVIGCLSFAVIVGVDESTERSEIAIGGRIPFRCHRDDIACFNTVFLAVNYMEHVDIL